MTRYQIPAPHGPVETNRANRFTRIIWLSLPAVVLCIGLPPVGLLVIAGWVWAEHRAHKRAAEQAVMYRPEWLDQIDPPER